MSFAAPAARSCGTDRTRAYSISPSATALQSSLAAVRQLRKLRNEASLGTVRYAGTPDHDIAPGHCLLCVGTPESALSLEA